jgi:hypothetical protein
MAETTPRLSAGEVAAWAENERLIVLDRLGEMKRGDRFYRCAKGGRMVDITDQEIARLEASARRLERLASSGGGRQP